VFARYGSKYRPAYAHYVASVDPAARADVVLDNTDPLAPVVLKWDA
jgi:hypothetical protein